MFLGNLRTKLAMEVIVFLVFYLAVCCGEEKELRLLDLQPLTGETWPTGAACLVPVKMAIDGINAHPDLLHGYKLTHEYVDIKVNMELFINSYKNGNVNKYRYLLHNV